MALMFGVGFLALTGIIFVAYIVFLVQQQKLQDELARRFTAGEEGAGRRGGTAILKSALKDYADQPVRPATF